MWAIAVKFLRGVCVATDTGQWDEAEWPPHPARLFMALAAAYFETCQPRESSVDDQKKRLALEWLEQQPAPRLFASDAITRTPVTVFVPVNDSTKTDQLFANARSRQPRYFPTSIPDFDELYYVWDGTIENEETAEGLKQIAFDVSRLGHSSSLVQVWIEQKFEDRVSEPKLNEWIPGEDSEGEATPLRIFAPGNLASYEKNYNLAAIEEYVGLQHAVSEAKGKDRSRLREELSKRFPHGMPSSQRPPASRAISYQRQDSNVLQPATSYFDDKLMVLEVRDSPMLGIESTLQLAGSIRKRIHDAYPNRQSPEWLSGHRPDGTPTDKPHVAFVPLPFVEPSRSDGRPTFADGHLLGLAIVFPRDVPDRERAIALRSIFERSDEDEDWIVRLQLHHFQRLTHPENPNVTITLVREQRLNPPRALRASTWTESCTVWETVTPIVLDRFPKRDRVAERQAWTEEVAGVIAASCENIGLPQPGAIHIHHNAFLEGVPKSRPERSGFPAMPTREGKPSRFQIHARIEFDVPVVGPVILGAGRFVGYGFCRPNHQRCKQRRGVK